MNTNLLLRDNSVDLTRRDAIARPTTFNATARTIDAVIATNAPVQRRDAQGFFNEILDVAGADLEALRGAPVLNSHSQGGLDSVIGAVDSARVEGSEIIATLRMSSRPEVAGIIEDISAGILRSLSVGYEVQTWADGTANGTRTRTAVKWKPREVSFVAVSADPNARTRESGRATINRQIRELATRAGCTEIADDLIDRSVSIEEARSAMLDNMLTRGRVSIVPSRHNNETLENPEVFHTTVGEALYARISPAYRPSVAAQQFVGQRIDEVARVCLNRAGVSTMGMNSSALITRALNTTSDFANILSNVVGRTMRAAYDVAPSGIKKCGRQTTAQDFRAKTRIMLDSSGFLLTPVNEHGEFSTGQMIDSAESYAVTTFGKIFGITRQALVNDDIGAFTDLSRRLGQAAAVFENQFLVNLLTAADGLGPLMQETNRNLFDESHGNVAASGADGPPTDVSLTAARLAMRQQTGPGGGLINVVPWALMVPPELETVGEKLLAEIHPVVIGGVNVWSYLQLITEPRLTNPLRWYLLADPSLIDGLEYAYLAGAQGPQVFTDPGFEIDGVRIKVRLDYGAGFIKSRGWYSNAGGLESP
jgi:hypothetical protein